MKRILLTMLILITLGSVTFAQNVLVSSDAMRVLFIGAENPISISIPGYTYAQIQLSVSVGNIRNDKNKGSYIWQVCDTKDTVTYLKAYYKKSLIDSFRFRIVSLPDLDVQFSRPCHMCQVSFKGLRVRTDNWTIQDIPYKILPFWVTIIRDHKRIDSVLNVGGAEFQKETQEMLKKTHSNDVITIDHIYAQIGCLPKPILLSPIGYFLF